MKTLLIIILCSYFASADRESYITGGAPVEPFSHPYLASVQVRIDPLFMHLCGGLILSPTWVLTAGTCLVRRLPQHVVSGKFDILEYEPGQQRVGVSMRTSVISSDSNLAMINLASPLVYDERTNETTLSQSDHTVQLGQNGRFIGWRLVEIISTEPQIQILKAANFKTVDVSGCEQHVNRRINSTNEFCTESVDGTQGACFGNLGSPFIEEGSGIISGILVDFPLSCVETDRPTGVFARIASYRGWIDEIMRN